MFSSMYPRSRRLALAFLQRRSLCQDSTVPATVSSTTPADDLQARYGKSPLYVVGDKLTHVESIVVPETDVRARCGTAAAREALERNLRARRRLTPKSTQLLEQMASGAEYLDWVEDERRKLETEQNSHRVRLEGLLGQEKKGELGELEKQEVEQLKAAMREARKKAKDLVRNRWELEDSVLLPFLNLPNDLHEDCPTEEEDRELFSSGERPQFGDGRPKSHLELAAAEVEMSPNSHTSFYLSGRLALLELELSRRAHTHLMDRDLSPASCPDFVKSLVVEGCGVDFSDPTLVLALEEAQDFKSRQTGQAMHLVGGASLYSFVALFCKNIVAKPQVLPRAFFCVGRKYHPSAEDSAVDLLNTRQSTAVQLFQVSAFEGRREFDCALDIVKDLYLGLGLHFRLLARAAHRLGSAECYRVAVEMWSTSRSAYVEVGSLSMFDDYLSKRMMLKGEDRKDLANLKVVAGTVMDITKVLACIVEGTQDSWRHYAP